MKSIQEINGKKRYKIIDEQGNIIKKGFRCFQAARWMIPSLKLNKHEKLKIVEE